MQVCERLPLVEVTWRPPRLASAREGQAQAGSEGTEGCEGSPAQLYTLEVHLRRLRRPRGGTNTRAYTPRFPKVGSTDCFLLLRGC